MWQTLYILLSVFFVSFTDKGGSPSPALSPRAVEQRARWGIPTDSLDYPVSAAYADSLRALGGEVLHTSRWLNGATIRCEGGQAEAISACSFVKSVEKTRDNSAEHCLRKQPHIAETPAEDPFRQTDIQLAQYNLPPLHEAGFRGQDIVMAVIDGGFQNYPVGSLGEHALNQVFDTARWLGTYDFTDDRDGIYGSTGSHGTICLGLIAGSRADYLGAAPQANYYLMRSEEDGTESPKEGDNLVAALETADSLGVNIASISLGYSWFDNPAWDYTYALMDGVSVRCSRAAQTAARKGMLVCVAAGNEGDKAWHYLTAPADADSILTVGAVTYRDGDIASFSSRGPSSDGRVKPEVCAVGAGACIIDPSDGSIVYGNGTSFACPLIAGMAACVWSALPDLTAMDIRERIIRSADRYRTPDTDYGYGIPDAWRAYLGEESALSPATTAASPARKIIRNGTIYIVRAGEIYDVLGRKNGK